MAREQQGDNPSHSYTQWIEYPRIQRLTEFDTKRGRVEWFLVLLRLNIAKQPYQNYNWVQIAKFDHHPEEDWGHDITAERLHLDVYQNGIKSHKERGFPEIPLDRAIRFCEDFIDKHYRTYVEQY